MHVLPTAHCVPPVQPCPPHCPYFATTGPVDAAVVVLVPPPEETVVGVVVIEVIVVVATAPLPEPEPEVPCPDHFRSVLAGAITA